MVVSKLDCDFSLYFILWQSDWHHQCRCLFAETSPFYNCQNLLHSWFEAAETVYVGASSTLDLLFFEPVCSAVERRLIENNSKCNALDVRLRRWPDRRQAVQNRLGVWCGSCVCPGRWSRCARLRSFSVIDKREDFPCTDFGLEHQRSCRCGRWGPSLRNLETFSKRGDELLLLLFLQNTCSPW